MARHMLQRVAGGQFHAKVGKLIRYGDSQKQGHARAHALQRLCSNLTSSSASRPAAAFAAASSFASAPGLRARHAASSTGCTWNSQVKCLHLTSQNQLPAETAKIVLHQHTTPNSPLLGVLGATGTRSSGLLAGWGVGPLVGHTGIP